MKEITKPSTGAKVYTNADKVKFINDKIKHYKEIKNELTRLRTEESLVGTVEEVLNSLVTKWEQNEASRASEVL